MPEGSAAFAAIVVVYFTGEPLGACLRSLADDRSIKEIVVVDNGSTPDEVAVVDGYHAAEPSRVRVIRGHGNIGFGRAVNLGTGAATAPRLLVLNPDAQLEPGCTAALEAALEGGRRPCLAGARVLDADGHEARGSRRGDFTPLATVLTLSRLARLPGLGRFELHHERDPLPDAPIPVATVSGAAFAMRRDDFLSLGGFDEGFFLHVEDVDLCWRVRQAGGEVLFTPGARVVHVGSTSDAPRLRVERWKGEGFARFFAKRARTPVERVVARLLGPLVIAAAIARPQLRRLMRIRPPPPTGEV